MYTVIRYIDHTGAMRFATVAAIPARIAEMRKRLSDAGFTVLGIIY